MAQRIFMKIVILRLVVSFTLFVTGAYTGFMYAYYSVESWRSPTFRELESSALIEECCKSSPARLLHCDKRIDFCRCSEISDETYH